MLSVTLSSDVIALTDSSAVAKERATIASKDAIKIFPIFILIILSSYDQYTRDNMAKNVRLQA